MAVLTYKALHNTAPRYLGPLVRVADIPVGTHFTVLTLTTWWCPLFVYTVGNGAFLIVAPNIWNSLPDIVSSASLSTFCRLLKTFV